MSGVLVKERKPHVGFFHQIHICSSRGSCSKWTTNEQAARPPAGEHLAGPVGSRERQEDEMGMGQNRF